MIAVDWGTSNFRAFRLDREGAILERRSFPTGILRVQDGRFAETLVGHLGDWISAGDRRILLCGMVGSREGWAEAEYVRCPVGAGDIAGRVKVIPFEGAQVGIIPGVMGSDVSGFPEVMRGEETETMGIREEGREAALVCLPGTHSKWVQMRKGVICNFSTCMTGDVFAALQQHTILARNVRLDAPYAHAAYLRGVDRSKDPGGLLHHMFSVRTLSLTGDLEQEDAASYLSGLLIGHEVRTMISPEEHVHLVGAIPLCKLYAQAIGACGGSFTLEDEDAAARGLAAIGRSLTWL